MEQCTLFVLSSQYVLLAMPVYFDQLHEYTRRMADRDQWTEVLRCPQCRTTGIAAFSQAGPDSGAYHDGDQNVRVEMTPSGFRAVVTDIGCEFQCVKCGSLAHHD